MASFIEISTSTNVTIKSTGGGIASLGLDAPTGSLPQIYNLIDGSAIWVSGITGYGGTNAFAWYSYPMGGPAFYINTNGNVVAAGRITFNFNKGSSGTYLSDARTKKDVIPFRAGPRQIVALNPVTYRHNGVADTVADGKVRTGLIAQDVKLAAPELVQSLDYKLSNVDSGAKPFLAVKYGDLTFALINAVKELKAENDNQATELVQIKKQLAAPRGQLEKSASVR